MKSGSEKFLFVLIAAAMLIQAYFLIFSGPADLKAGWQNEKSLNIQGKDAGIEQGFSEDKPLLIPNATLGEGQVAPKIPKSSQTRTPEKILCFNRIENRSPLKENKELSTSLIYGVIILQNKKGLELNPEQAKKILKFLDTGKAADSGITKVYKILLEILTDDQLKYITGLKPKSSDKPDDYRYIEDDLSALKKNMKFFSKEMQVIKKVHLNNNHGGPMPEWRLSSLIKRVAELEKSRYKLTQEQKGVLYPAIARLDGQIKYMQLENQKIRKVLTPEQEFYLNGKFADHDFMNALIYDIYVSGRAKSGISSLALLRCRGLLNEKTGGTQNEKTKDSIN